MNKIQRLINQTLDLTDQSTMKPQMAALMVKGNRIINQGVNTPGYFRFLPTWSRHAEVMATLNRNCNGATMFIARKHQLLKSPMLAKPCKHCNEWLMFVGVKEVVYTIPEYPYYQVETV